MKLPASIARIASRYRTQAGSIRKSAHEFHDLRTLSARLLLSPAEALEQVAAGNLISLSSANGKHLFSSRSLDSIRGRVVDFIASEIVEELSARGFDEDRICLALERAFRNQYELSRGPEEKVVSFARTPQDDSDDDFYGDAKRAAATAAGVGAAGLAGYGAYRYLKGRNGGNGGNALPGGSQPLLPPGPGPSGDAMGARHPGPPAGASISAPITTASSTTRKTVGNSVVDPLADAVVAGKRAITRRGAGIWQALRGIPLE